MIGVALLAAGPASAAQTAAVPSIDQPKAAHEFGPTLPPIGFVRFCAALPSQCTSKGSKSAALELTPENWRDLYQVNALVNAKIKPVSDMELYGQPEVWALPTDAGDCEDYLLLKKKYLEALGFPSSSLLITVVLDERKEGHALLTVVSSEGDFVLDNRRNDILRWNDSGYSFLKRQSRDNPKKWVALVKKPTVATGAISASNKN